MKPGELLAVLIQHRGWTQARLAEALGRPPQLFSELVTGKKRFTGATARQLEAALGLQARVWRPGAVGELMRPNGRGAVWTART